MLVRRALWAGAIVVGAMAAFACGDPEIDDELPDLSPPSGARRGRGGGNGSSTGGLPKPAPNGGSSSGKEAPDGGSEEEQPGESSSGDPTACDDPDEPNWASDIEDEDYYYIEPSNLDGRLEIQGVLGDYYDFDTFGIDVGRHVTPTLFIPNPPPKVRLCAYLLCWSGDPTNFTCDTGTEDEHEGMIGCCGSSTVSMGYSRCSGSVEDITVYARVTADDVDQQCVPYTLRTSL